jgi:hypothetical protein
VPLWFVIVFSFVPFLRKLNVMILGPIWGSGMVVGARHVHDTTTAQAVCTATSNISLCFFGGRTEHLTYSHVVMVMCGCGFDVYRDHAGNACAPHFVLTRNHPGLERVSLCSRVRHRVVKWPVHDQFGENHV